MSVNDDYRLLCKQERSLRISLENMKEFAHAHQAGADRHDVDLRIAKLDEIWEKFVGVRLRIEMLTEDVGDGDIFH